MNAVCAGCRTVAPQETDKVGYKRMTPTGWLWLTALRGGGKWYFCSLACVADWSARCRDGLERLAV